MDCLLQVHGDPVASGAYSVKSSETSDHGGTLYLFNNVENSTWPCNPSVPKANRLALSFGQLPNCALKMPSQGQSRHCMDQHQPTCAEMGRATVLKRQCACKQMRRDTLPACIILYLIVIGAVTGQNALETMRKASLLALPGHCLHPLPVWRRKGRVAPALAGAARRCVELGEGSPAHLPCSRSQPLRGAFATRQSLCAYPHRPLAAPAPCLNPLQRLRSGETLSHRPRRQISVDQT